MGLLVTEGAVVIEFGLVVLAGVFGWYILARVRALLSDRQEDIDTLRQQVNGLSFELRQVQQKLFHLERAFSQDPSFRGRR